MKKVLLAFIGAFVFLASCTKENPTKEHNNPEFENNLEIISKLVEEENGRLIFKDKKAFEKSIQIILNTQQENSQIFSFEELFPGFKSNKLVFEELSEDLFNKELNGEKIDFNSISDYGIIVEHDGELFFEPIINTDILPLLYNDKNILQIGDSLYKFTKDYTVRAHFTKIEELVNHTTVNPNKSFFYFPNIIEKTQIDFKNNQSTECRVDYDARFRRLRGGAWTVKTIIYNSLYVETTNLRRPCRGDLCIWYQIKTDYLKLQASGTYHYPGSAFVGGPFNVSQEGYNTSEISKTIDFSVNSSIFPTIQTLNGLHKITWNSTNVECSTNM